MGRRQKAGTTNRQSIWQRRQMGNQRNDFAGDFCGVGEGVSNSGIEKMRSIQFETKNAVPALLPVGFVPGMTRCLRNPQTRVSVLRRDRPHSTGLGDGPNRVRSSRQQGCVSIGSSGGFQPPKFPFGIRGISGAAKRRKNSQPKAEHFFLCVFEPLCGKKLQLNHGG